MSGRACPFRSGGRSPGLSGRACLSADRPARSVQAGGVEVCQVERSRGLSGRAESRPHYFKTIVQYLSTSPRDYGSHFDRVPFQDVDKSHISGWSSAAICLVWRTKTANNVLSKAHHFEPAIGKAGDLTKEVNTNLSWSS